MSVALFSARELGSFAATIAHLEIATVEQAIGLAETIGYGNVAAWNAQYGESDEAVAREEIASVAKKLVGDEDALIAAHWGPMVYNMVTNNGTYFIAPGVERDGEDELFQTLREIEKRCHKWQEAKGSELARKEENAVAFDQVGQQKTMTGSEIAEECKSLGYLRVIIAEFSVNESDSMTDYWGGRHTRTVVIGYGKGKRESFKQLREAAAGFKPTECFGPGKGLFTARVVYAGQYQVGNGRHVYEGTYSPWHEEIGNGTEFDTKAKAEAFIAEAGEPGVVVDGGTECHFKWEIGEKEIEHRENYSMGGGNYLGFNRYGGWKVSSNIVGNSNSDKPVEVAPFKRVPVKSTKATKKANPTAEVVEHEVEDGTHCLTVKAGKRKITIVYSVGKYSPSISVCAGRSRFGKWFSSWDRAKASYRTANIKAAIEAAESAVATRLDESSDSVAVDEPKAVSVDPAAFDEFAWL